MSARIAFNSNCSQTSPANFTLPSETGITRTCVGESHSGNIATSPFAIFIACCSRSA
ncbi:Uncharacterised protein [uncultured archaeon]|nr:Uncharacterised protein [uncultured archaeon]